MQVDAAIIILSHNGENFTAHCLEGILAAADQPRELFLIDNCSDDGIPALFARMVPRFEAAGIKVTTWRNAENKGCSLARNEAWEKATSSYVVFMDNDAVPCTRTWLSRLAAAFVADPRLGILGPKMIYPWQPHKIQCAGVAISTLGRIAFLGRGADRLDPLYNQPRSCHALISATWMMRNELRHSVGLLDELFHPVQYEDIDLCIRAELAGWTVGYTPEVEMYHFEGITTASFGDKEYQRNIARNSLKFREKWHKVYATYRDELPNDAYRWLARDELGLRPELDLALQE